MAKLEVKASSVWAQQCRGTVAYDGKNLWVGEFKFSTRILRFSPR